MCMRITESEPFGPGGLSMRGLCPCLGAAIVGLACFFPLAASPATAGEPPKKLLHLSFEDETWVAFSKSRATALVDYPNFVEGKKGRGARNSNRHDVPGLEQQDRHCTEHDPQ